MGLRERARYYCRIAASYLGRQPSQLSFWWERPAVHPDASPDSLGPYWMTFRDKARYAGPFDDQGVPLLDYHGALGKQHNPIAIAQYGLAKLNAFLETGQDADRAAFLRQADWLAENLRPNPRGVRVWMHDFDWEYAEGLRAPWYSGLAQGQGLSLLVRAHAQTQEPRYAAAAREVFDSILTPVEKGGVALEGPGEDWWIEEYITDPPSHILNGYLWAIWGLHDYALATGDSTARSAFARGSRTIERHLDDYDLGWWSTYDLLPTRVRCIASPFYHQLHIVQLRIMHSLTGQSAFVDRADLWEGYARSGLKRRRALAQKAAFKLLYY